MILEACLPKALKITGLSIWILPLFLVLLLSSHKELCFTSKGQNCLGEDKTILGRIYLKSIGWLKHCWNTQVACDVFRTHQLHKPSQPPTESGLNLRARRNQKREEKKRHQQMTTLDHQMQLRARRVLKMFLLELQNQLTLRW